MNEEKKTRRERQAEQLKSEILEAAVKTFTQFGYEKATTKKIAKEADVSEGTLYYYFQNKREILITLFKILIDNINSNLVKVSSDSDNLNTMLSKGMAHQYSQINSLPILSLFLHEAGIDPEVKEIFSQMMLTVRTSATNLLKHLEEQGKMKKVNHENVALLMSLIGIGYMTLIESGDSYLTKIPLNKLTDDFAQILVSGLNP